MKVKKELASVLSFIGETAEQSSYFIEKTWITGMKKVLSKKTKERMFDNVIEKTKQRLQSNLMESMAQEFGDLLYKDEIDEITKKVTEEVTEKVSEEVKRNVQHKIENSFHE